MYDAIAQIGRIVSSAEEQGVLAFLIKNTDRFKYLVGINFDLTKNTVQFLLLKSSKEKLPEKVLNEFVYVGNEKASRKQFAPTTDNLLYLISQSLPNLAGYLENGSPLKEQIIKVVNKFFMSTRNPGDARYGRILNDQFVKQFNVHYQEVNEKLKDDVVDYANNLKEIVCSHLGIKPRETLFTVLINSQPIAKTSEYQSFVIRLNLEENFQDSRPGICSICGQEKRVTSNTTRFLMKFYMVDKINFASYFDHKNFYKAVALCEDCYKNFLIGENWIAQNLNTRLGGFNLYIIPQLVSAFPGENNLFQNLKNIPQAFNDIKNIKQIQEIEKDAIRKNFIQQGLLKNPFVWNFLFYKKTNSAFKILTLIKDVPPSRILTLLKTTSEVEQFRQKFLPEWITFDLEQIYQLIPIKRKRADLLEFKKVLQIYYNIISGLPIDVRTLYGFFKTLAHIHHFESYAIYQINGGNNSDLALVKDTLRWNLFMLFLRKLNLINGGKFMLDQELEKFYPEGMKAFMQEMNYSREQQGLALLGYVIGTVAYAQVKSNLNNKPVLDKISYQGMSDEKVIRLFNEIFEKIRQYNKLIGYAERWWAAAKKLYESGDRNALTADERVFYLLSGYALNTISSHTTKDNNQNQNN